MSGHHKQYRAVPLLPGMKHRHVERNFPPIGLPDGGVLVYSKRDLGCFIVKDVTSEDLRSRLRFWVDGGLAMEISFSRLVVDELVSVVCDKTIDAFIEAIGDRPDNPELPQEGVSPK